MGPDRDRTRDPWICSQIRICSQTLYRLRYAARHKMLIMKKSAGEKKHSKLHRMQRVYSIVYHFIDGKYTDVARVDVTICVPPTPMPPVVVPPNTNNNAGTVVSSNDTLFWLIPALLLLALMGGLLAFLAYRCYRNGQW